MYICVTESLAVHLKLTQRKSTLLQLKKKKKPFTLKLPICSKMMVSTRYGN